MCYASHCRPDLFLAPSIVSMAIATQWSSEDESHRSKGALPKDDLQFELLIKQEELTKKFSRELHSRGHSKKEELAKTENEFKHQLEKKEKEIQECSHILQDCLDALRTQKLKNKSQNIQLLHQPQGMYCI